MSQSEPEGMSEFHKLINRKAKAFTEQVEHIELNATEEDADTIIKSIRFMAYAKGFEDCAAHLLQTCETWCEEKTDDKIVVLMFGVLVLSIIGVQGADFLLKKYLPRD